MTLNDFLDVSICHVHIPSRKFLANQAPGYATSRTRCETIGQPGQVHTCACVFYCRVVTLIHITYRLGYLVVAQAHTSDSGVYKCLASNPLGNATAPAHVVVTGTLLHRPPIQVG